jgi:hypothetical protein
MSFCERQRLRATARSAKNLALQRGDAASTEKRCLFVRPLLVGSNRRREWIAGLRPKTLCRVSYRSDFPQATHAAAVERALIHAVDGKRIYLADQLGSPPVQPGDTIADEWRLRRYRHRRLLAAGRQSEFRYLL